MISNLLKKKILEKYTVNLLKPHEFQSLLDDKFVHYFNPIVLFSPDGVFQSHRKSVLEQNPLKLGSSTCTYISVNDPSRCDKPIALFKGTFSDPNQYSMDLTVIHPEYRRQGVYTGLLDAILGYTHEAGFSLVKSTHNVSNNPIIIAKLKRGFHLGAFTVSPFFGPEVELWYFHNSALKNAYLFRSGRIVSDQTLKAHAKGSLDKLRKALDETKDG